jgi:hypothetical protein
VAWRCPPVVADQDGAVTDRHAGLDLRCAEYVVARHQARAAAASCRRAKGAVDSDRDYGGRRPASAPKEPSAATPAALPVRDNERTTVDESKLRRVSLRAGAARAQGPVAGPEAPSRPTSDRRAATPAPARHHRRREPEDYEPPLGSGLAVAAGGAARGDSGPAPAAGHEQARRQTTRIAGVSPDVGGATTATAARATEAKARIAELRCSSGPARGATAETASAGGRNRAVTASPTNDDRQDSLPAYGERGSDMRTPATLPTAAPAAGRAVQFERRRLHTRGHGPLVHPRLVEDHSRGGRFGLGDSTTQSAERRADRRPDSHRGRRPEPHGVKCQFTTKGCQPGDDGPTTSYERVLRRPTSTAGSEGRATGERHERTFVQPVRPRTAPEVPPAGRAWSRRSRRP